MGKTSAKGGELISFTKQNPAASGSSSRVHNQLNKKISRARLGSKVLPNLVTPGGVELGQMAKFVKAWNDADCPDGPSLTAKSLQGVEDSLTKLKGQLEVTITSCSLSTHDRHYALPPNPRDLGCIADTPWSRIVIRLESQYIGS